MIFKCEKTDTKNLIKNLIIPTIPLVLLRYTSEQPMHFGGFIDNYTLSVEKGHSPSYPRKRAYSNFSLSLEDHPFYVPPFLRDFDS